MVANEKRRQKKLERRNAKRKQRRHSMVKAKNRGLAERLAAAARAPVLHSLVMEGFWEEGIGYAVFSRRLPNGDVAYAMFLIDRYCMGVKDAFANVVCAAEYESFLDELSSQLGSVELPPADLRCLVEDAVEYARDLGFEPHPDYHRAKPILSGIDPDEAKERFDFGGEDGKPHFIAGPNDDSARCNQILSILEHHCGPGGFHFTIPLSTEAERMSTSPGIHTIALPADDDD